MGKFAGKSVFLTGVTGFMGKVLMEKVLRCLEVDTVYVLIRAKRGKSVSERLEKILEAPLFEKLATAKPDFKGKVVAIEGDTSRADFGIRDRDLQNLVDDVAVVFHCAASVKFQEPLLSVMSYNICGRHEFPHLLFTVTPWTPTSRVYKVMIYLSTAYAHCYKRNIDEIVYPTNVCPSDLLGCANWMSRDMMDKVAGDMICEHPNSYTYTKALAENLIEKTCKKRTVIVRPSIVTSAQKEPIPGWCDSINGPVGLIVSFGKGLLRTMLGKRDAIANFVPVDVAINLMIAAGWKSATAQCEENQNITIYNCTNTEDNPFTWGDLSDCVTQSARLVPLENPVRLPAYDSTISPSRLKYDLEWRVCHWLPAYFADALLVLARRKRRFVSLYGRIRSMCDSLAYFTTRSWKWSNNNVKALVETMSPDDRMVFYIDFSDLDWKEYMTEYHAGVKKYILKEKSEDTAHATKQLKQLHRLELLTKALLVVSALFCAFKCGMAPETTAATLFCAVTTYYFCSLLNSSSKRGSVQ